MNTTESHIIEFARRAGIFYIGDLKKDLSAKVNLSEKMLSWHLSRLVSNAQLTRIGRGLYSSMAKQAFRPAIDDNALNIAKSLKTHFPLLTFCVYNGEILSPLQHHLSYNNNIYIETEREAVETIFHTLQAEIQKVFMSPSAEMISEYIHLDSKSIIVKPLVSESPLVENESVFIPTLEKLLVDIRCDRDFFYLQGIEAQRMTDNAFSLYNINIPSLLRYARRRNKRKEFQNYIDPEAI